ncbi:phosphatidylserine decarboxylase [Bacillus sp. FSL K6-3431]|uniref:phosphatidylserine decarboxylase n=1 Tax=Bacillus sp. FSL K6-3431 TaxID=2921500 RepID=UPI0030FA85B6
MKGKLYRGLIQSLNGPVVSNVLLKYAQSKWSKPIIKFYARAYRINVAEMRDNMETYPNLHAFFTRRLKTDSRPINFEPNTIVSPVDGILEDCGTISPACEIIVKHKAYSISEMLGGEDKANKYIGGTYLILYLSPSHYHRIHSPIDGKVVSTYSLGGKSYPVNRLGLKYGNSTLAKNFRIVTELKHHTNSMAMVKVGAMFINSVKVVNQHHEWKKGDEVAYFSFGSTVVLLFEKGMFQLKQSLSTPAEIRMGEHLGKCVEIRKERGLYEVQ